MPSEKKRVSEKPSSLGATCNDNSQVQSSVAFLLEAARYFENRPTGGEDAAHWSNVQNAQNCRRAADQLRNCQTLLDGCPLPRRLQAAASLLYVHGYIPQAMRVRIAGKLNAREAQSK